MPFTVHCEFFLICAAFCCHTSALHTDSCSSEYLFFLPFTAPHENLYTVNKNPLYCSEQSSASKLEVSEAARLQCDFSFLCQIIVLSVFRVSVAPNYNCICMDKTLGNAQIVSSFFMVH